MDAAGPVLDATVIAATMVALFTGHRAVRTHRPPDQVGTTPSPSGTGFGGLGSPVRWLAVVTGMIYLNQVLFTVYVIRVWHGDPSFIARYLPDGWFDLATGPAMTALARYVPAPGLLAPSVLRIQAFCELPFVVFAYLTACHWFSPDLYRRLSAPRILWPVCASYTVTFGLIEWSLRNPYTLNDLVLRIAAAIAVPIWVARSGQRNHSHAPADPYPASPATLLASLASAAALGYLVLVVYDTALLYNLGHLGSRLPGTATACAVLASARLAARRLTHPNPTPDTSLEIYSLAATIRWFLTLFFIPALPIRYGIGFGSAPLAAAATGLILLTAPYRGAREAFDRIPPTARRRRTTAAWALRMAAPILAGTTGALLALAWHSHYPETTILRATVLAGAFAITTCAISGPTRPSRKKSSPPPRGGASAPE